jgi:hypothetical protein
MAYGVGLAVLLAQLVSIFALFRALRRRDKAEVERDREITENADQERLFASVINSIPDSILIADTESKIFTSNTAALRIFGFEDETLVDMSIGDLVLDSTGEDANVPLAIDMFGCVDGGITSTTCTFAAVPFATCSVTPVGDDACRTLPLLDSLSVFVETDAGAFASVSACVVLGDPLL